MNLYFLMEDGKSARKVYPSWIEHLCKGMTKKDRVDEVTENNFFIISGEGYPSIFDVFLEPSIQDMNDAGNFDYLVICLDSDGRSTKEIRKEALDRISKCNIRPKNYKIQVIVQQICFETWLLGNRNPKTFKRNPSDPELVAMMKHFDVYVEDPEKMKKMPGTQGTIGDFHYKYLKLLLKERKINYSKSKPRGVTEIDYLEELILRTQETPHLQSLKEFFDFCKNIAP